MASTPNRGRAPKGRMKTGICENHNYFNPKTDQTGDCPKCASGERITVEVKRLSDFRCPVCDGNLTPVKESSKKWMWIGIAIAVVAIAAIVLCLKIPSGQKEIGHPQGEEVVVTPPQGNNDSDTVKKDTVIGKDPQVETPQPPQPPVPPRGGNGKTSPDPQTIAHKLPYGSWNGGWKNGQPHGNGTMTYSTSHVIDSRDPKGREAVAGEYVIGEWDNGHLVQGRWFKNDGTKESIIIGKAG